MSNELDEKKTKYFVIAIILLIILSVILIIHYNNKTEVNGEEDKKTITTTQTTTTTTMKTTTKKQEIKETSSKKEEVSIETSEQSEDVSKTTIDTEHKLIYNYKTNNEINDTDKIISTVIEVDEDLKNNNILKIYDISLYDINLLKKEVKNSLINISIPITDDLKGFDEYKIVYIDEEGNISNEEFETKVEDGYIKFTTTHLSKFGIIAKIDLESVKIDIKINDKTIKENNIYVSTNDKLDIIVNGLECDYKLYYMLKDETNAEYKEFNDNYIFKDIKTPSKFILTIKVEVNNTPKIIDIGNISVYDIVFKYDKTQEVIEDNIDDEIKDENGVESNYADKDTNKNIVIDNIETEEDLLNNDNNDATKNEELNQENKNINDDTVSDETEDGKQSEEVELTIPEQENNDIPVIEENVAKIELKGNIYIVEQTDISNLEITGYLIIDTKEDIIFKKEEEQLLISNIYTITIKSKEFSINGIKYTYKYVNEELIIEKIEDGTNALEEINNLFKGYDIVNDKNDLILNKNQTNQ